jgi:hypothetical protein
MRKHKVDLKLENKSVFTRNTDLIFNKFKHLKLDGDFLFLLQLLHRTAALVVQLPFLVDSTFWSLRWIA